jgi:carboxyl-terminal processing protease
MEKADPFLTRRQPKARETQWQDDLPTIWNRYEATLRVRKRDDKVQEYTYRPFRLDADAPREHSSKANIYRKRQEHTEGRWIREGAVGYIRIPSFSEHHYAEEALSCVQQFSSAQTIILDMRYNGGGGTPLSLTKAMMDRPYRWWSETSPNIGHLRRRNPESSQFTILPDGSGAHCVNDYEESTECLFTGKVIVLTSRYAASAAEDIIMPFKDTGRGILVGEPTWGSTGQPVCFDYHNLHVGIGAVRAYMPDGTPFEGIGIQPDVPVWRTRDDMYKGRDPILERALELSE